MLIYVWVFYRVLLYYMLDVKIVFYWWCCFFWNCYLLLVSIDFWRFLCIVLLLLFILSLVC